LSHFQPLLCLQFIRRGNLVQYFNSHPHKIYSVFRQQQFCFLFFFVCWQKQNLIFFGKVAAEGFKYFVFGLWYECFICCERGSPNKTILQFINIKQKQKQNGRPKKTLFSHKPTSAIWHNETDTKKKKNTLFLTCLKFDTWFFEMWFHIRRQLFLSIIYKKCMLLKYFILW
jgi:hypothetical protein